MRGTLRNVLGWLLACILIKTGYVRRAISKSLKGECILSIYFHHPTKKEFESSVKWLRKNGFTFLSPSRLEGIIQKEQSFPRGAVILTIDDGWRTNEANIVEVAEKYGVPVTIFISTQPVEEGVYWWSYLVEARRAKLSHPSIESLKKVPNEERIGKLADIIANLKLKREAMTVDQVKRVSDSKYVTVGGHTHTHPILTNCTDEQVYLELQHSKTTLEAWTEKPIAYFAYPNGDYGEREIHALQELDYRLAFTCDSRPITPLELQNNFMLPRYGFLEGASFAENMCRMVGVWHPVMQKLKVLFRTSQPPRRAEQTAKKGNGNVATMSRNVAY